MPADPLQQFFGDKPKHEKSRRRALALGEVAESNDGLKALAAGGNWAAVQNLSAKLAQRQIDRSTGKRDIEPYLQYALVQLTALCKTEQYAAANEVLDRLGDLDGAAYVDAAGRCLVPFSLRYLHAALPNYVGKADIGYQRLLILLERVTKERTALQSHVGTNDLLDASPRSLSGEMSRSIIDSGTAATLAMSSAELERRVNHRWRRVVRGLAVNAIERGDHALGLDFIRRLADTATTAIESMFLLQQVGCAALRCGDFAAALIAFKAGSAELADDEDKTEEMEELTMAVTQMNTALVDVFCGRFNEALKRLHEVAAPVLQTQPDSLRVNTSRSPTAAKESSSPAAGAPIVQELLAQNAASHRTGAMDAMFTLRLLAANTFIVCHQYAVGSERCTIPNSIASFEGLLRRYPVEASRMQATLINMKRLYEWQGESTGSRRVVLEAIVDAFVTSREAAPRFLRG
jgi:hypothetical protein